MKLYTTNASQQNMLTVYWFSTETDATVFPVLFRWSQANEDLGGTCRRKVVSVQRRWLDERLVRYRALGTAITRSVSL